MAHAEDMGHAESHDETVVLGAEGMAAALEKVAREIANAHEDIEKVALLGILSRGVPLAERLADRVAAYQRARPKTGSLATTLYRDDLRSSTRSIRPVSGETYFDFNIDGMCVVLVDDVLHRGRTVRAALDELMDYGRPARVQLAVLIDRGGRELPIQPDYCGWSLGSPPDDRVAVRLKEVDGEDAVVVVHHTDTRHADGEEADG